MFFLQILENLFGVIQQRIRCGIPWGNPFITCRRLVLVDYIYEILFTLAPCGLFTKEFNPRLGKRPLVFNGRLVNRGLTSLIKEATGQGKPALSYEPCISIVNIAILLLYYCIQNQGIIIIIISIIIIVIILSSTLSTPYPS